MERYQLEDMGIVFDCAGRDDWGKFSFPVWYGIPVKLNWQGYEFDFNLRGSLKRLVGNLSVWPDPREVLKRTDGNDLIYYGTDGYEFSYDLIKNYYVPFNGRSDCGVFAESPLEGRHVKRALKTFDRLVERAEQIAPFSPRGRPRDFLLKIASKNRAILAGEAKKLHSIIGGRLPVLPPDTIDVDYEVIPLIITEGCSYKCRFCRFKTKGGFSIRSRQNIAGQIKALRGLYSEDLVNYNSLILGQNNALAAGEDILVSTGEMAYDVLKLPSSFHRGRPNLFIFGSAGSFLQAVDSLFDRLDRLPYHTYLNVGLESPDQETLDGLGKPLRAERVREAFRKLQEVNQRYPHITVSCNFVLGKELPPRHVEGIKTFLSGEVFYRGKGVVYLSPLLGASYRRQILKEFREIKINSSLPVFLYLAQRL